MRLLIRQMKHLPNSCSKILSSQSSKLISIALDVFQGDADHNLMKDDDELS
jgi:hypothetical protein